MSICSAFHWSTWIGVVIDDRDLIWSRDQQLGVPEPHTGPDFSYGISRQ